MRGGASDALYRGEAQDFSEAMHLLLAAVQQERPSECQEDPEYVERFGANGPHFDALAAAAERCLREYRATTPQYRPGLAKAWQASGDPDVRRIGLALESGDYSGLAI